MVVDTPEMQRLKKTQDQISNVSGAFSSSALRYQALQRRLAAAMLLVKGRFCSAGSCGFSPAACNSSSEGAGPGTRTGRPNLRAEWERESEI